MTVSEGAASGGRASVALRTLGLMLLVGVAAASLARCGARAIVRSAKAGVVESETAFALRTSQMLAALPAIVAQEHTALFVGASRVAWGFSPLEFDRRLAEHGVSLTTYNLGNMLFNPQHLVFLNRRIEESYAAAGRKSDVMLIEFAPDAATDTFSKRGMAPDKLVAMINGREFLELARERRELGVTMATIWMLGGVAPNTASDLVTNALFTTPTWWRGAKHDDPDAVFNQLLERLDEVRGPRRASWDPALRGQFSWRYPGAEDHYQRFVDAALSDERMKKQRERVVVRNDAVELHLDEQMIDHFIEAANQTKQIARRSFIVLLPRNLAWAQPSAAGLERVRLALAKISKATGMDILDCTDGYDSSDFFDPGHLNELTGVPKFAHDLADRVAAKMSVTSPAR